MVRKRRNNERDDPWTAPDPALALAIQQVRYYARNCTRFRRVYRASEGLILLATATTTVVAALKATAWVTATLAASTVVLTGMNKIVDTHDRYVASISAWAELQVAVNDYRLLPEDRRDEEARKGLVTKVNEVMKADTERWASRRRDVIEQHD
jgi:hypothetical protein